MFDCGRSIRMFTLVWLMAVISSLTVCTAVVSEAAEFQKIKVAVLDFQQNGSFSNQDVGKIVAEWFTTSLVETGRFEVIERRLLQQILQEQKMGASGLMDPASASRLGKVLGVKTIVTGTVQSYDRTYELNVRLINVETGAIITADRVRAGSTSSLPDLVNQVSARIIRHFPLEGYVVQRSGNTALVDLGRLAGVKPGLQFNVYVEGAPVRHPKTGEVLFVDRVHKGLLSIREVRDKTAVADILQEDCVDCISSGQLISSIQELAEPVPQTRLGVMSREDEKHRAEAEQKEQERFEKEAAEREKDRKKAEERAREQEKSLVTPKPQNLGGLAVVSAFAGRTEFKSIASSPSGALVASGDDRGGVFVWDVAKKSGAYSLDGYPKGDVTAVQFSSDGRMLVTAGGDKKLIVWDLARQKQIAVLELKDKVTDLEFSNNGRFVAIGTRSKEAFVWDFRSGKLKSFKHVDDTLAVALSHDGRFLATAGKGKRIALWDAGSGKQLRLLSGHDNDVRGLAYLPGGRQLLSIGDDKLVFLWDLANGTVAKILRGHDDNVVFMAVAADGKRAVTAERRRSGGLIIFWDLVSGKELKRVKAERRIDLLTMALDGKSLIVASEKELTVYRLE